MVRPSSSLLAVMAGALSLGAFVSCSSSEEGPGSGAGAPATAGATGVSGGFGAGSGGAPVMPSGGSGGSLPSAGSAGSAQAGAGGAGSGAGGASGAAGMAGSVSAGASGAAGKGGAAGASGAAGSAGASGSGGGGGAAGSGGAGGKVFSFFVSSMKAMQQLSGKSAGFGGDLRFGGKADGLSGADEICRQTAELGVPGAGQRQWRAFLSAAGPPAVNARDRIGPGPWYDKNLRLVANNLTDLLSGPRPKGDPMIINDLPNERGEPNHFVGENGYTAMTPWDTHDVLTGSKADGTVFGGKSTTCNDWTSAVGNTGQPRIGHSWPRSAGSMNGAQWASDHNARGCAAGFNLNLNNGGGEGDCVGCGGGYGALYCFALP